MAISAGKYAPSAVVLVAVAYGVWPTASSLMSASESRPPEKVTEMSASIFSPKLPPPPARDPFGGSLLAARLSKGAASAAAAAKAKAARTAVETAEATRRAIEAKARLAIAAGAKKAVQGFTLQAVSIVGDQAMAMIDNRLYSPGDTLRLPGFEAAGKSAKRGSPARQAAAADAADLPLGSKGARAAAEPPSYKVVAVLADKVLLEFQEETLVLTYSDAKSGPASSKAAKGAGAKKSASKGGRSRGGKSSSKK
jgi:hypothetical protein